MKILDYFINQSIFRKFMFLILVILILNTFVLSIIYLYYGKNYSYRLYYNKARILLSFFTLSSGYGLLIGDKENLELLSQLLFSDPDIIHVSILNASGEVILKEGVDLSAFYSKIFSSSNVNIMPVQLQIQKILFACGNVYGPSLQVSEENLLTEEKHQKLLGKVCIGLDLSRLSITFSKVRNKVIAVSIIITIFSVLAAYFLGRIISHPLKMLTDAARVFSRGELPKPLKISSRDEVGELTEAFNNMVSQISHSQKELCHYAHHLEDLVEERTQALRQSLEELQIAYQELKKIHDVKTKFLQKASHELRTPLTAIKANLDFIFSYETKKLDDDLIDLLLAIKRNTIQMYKLVEDMLTIVRCQDKKLKLERKPTRLKNLIFDCINQLKPLIGKRRVFVEVPENLILYIDPDRFRDIIVNLLTNSIRFTTEDDNISFRVEEELHQVKILVSDTGEGIDPKHLPHLFEPFYQADHRKGGTGLGLSIVKAIVEEHGGHIDVVSEPGKGTTFIIILPLEDIINEKRRKDSFS